MNSFASSLEITALAGRDLPSFDRVASFLRDRMLPDGTFKNKASDVEGSISNTHRALDILSHYQSFAGAMEEFLTPISSIIPSGNDENLVDSTILSKFILLSSKKNFSRRSAALSSLVALARSKDFEVVSRAISSLRSVAQTKFSPVAVDFDVKTVNADDTSKKVHVHVTNILGEPVEGSISVVSLVGPNGVLDAPTINEKGEFFLPKDMSVGSYVVEVAVDSPDRKKPISVEKTIIVLDVLSIENVSAGVSLSKSISSSDVPIVNSPSSMENFQVSSLDGDVFHVFFQVKSFSQIRPHQTFVKFTHVESGNSCYFVAKLDGNFFHATIALGEYLSTFDYLSGGYSISLLVGDAMASNPIQWTLGQVNLKFLNKPSKDYPLYTRSLLHTSDNALSALPEIEHVMQPPAKRASPFMSSLFTGLVLLPLLVFLGVLLKVGPNLFYLRSLSSILFVISLAAVLALYLGYWLALDGVSFYDTLKYLAMLFPLTVLLGSYALSSVTSLRLASVAQKEKSN